MEAPGQRSAIVRTIFMLILLRTGISRLFTREGALRPSCRVRVPRCRRSEVSRPQRTASAMDCHMQPSGAARREQQAAMPPTGSNRAAGVGEAAAPSIWQLLRPSTSRPVLCAYGAVPPIPVFPMAQAALATTGRHPPWPGDRPHHERRDGAIP
mmetsp:Transcript_4094/g.11964  ORF Transcript_4094/g.11964 Transcript_4094/m.11964 type:complete len:154 (+) Transcript_4094:65-526(+)